MILELEEPDNVIISLSNNHNNNINYAIAKCGASAIEEQHFNNAVANPDILINLNPEKWTEVLLLLLLRDQKFLSQYKNSLICRIGFYCMAKFLLGKLAVGEIVVGEVVTGEMT